MYPFLRAQRLWRVTVALLAVSLFCVPAAAAGADDSTVAADIIQFGFEPATLQVAPGTTVTWTNHDAIIHSVTSGTPATPDAIFDSGFFDEGATFSFTFTDPGDYSYFCMRHKFMVGTVSVAAN